uniref:Major Capsid Protein n=1 Tax=Ribes TaxID=3801 RepID=UPI0023BB1B9D|nr:Chain G, Major Capsid Protein [Ribes]8CJZ_H Chain H, Major Capsid Protein [Ribes]8CJZ_I Chain I, Major Capsid Protein [Ribes]8CJZ_J Chain J, Major Capsid Protein [Ribes]8CJZ_K Chain K, Major Capsid Protein [Ribes]8CJZ_Y Chain Y, Major Capsid Protein [Ribes]8CJZ_g Chain g, Major Capsid Protein [Ribes]
MATLGNTYLTLADVQKQKDGKGNVTSEIIEMLAETNPILEDMVVMECNDGTGHLTTIRTGLPQATWRRLYEGVQPAKSTTRQIKDSTGTLEAWSEVDEKLVKLSKDKQQLMLNEAAAFLEGMNQTMASTLFYGNTATDAVKFMGLAPRFNAYRAARNLKPVDTADQVIDAGGTGSDLTSIWMVVWGDRTAHGLYPEGTSAGLQREYLGAETKELGDGGVYRVVREKFEWDLGLTVRDFRYVVRIANIDVSDLQAGTIDIYALLRKAYYRLENRVITGGRAALYCNADVTEAMDAAATPTSSTTASYVRLTPMQVDGKEVMMYRGIPVRECDAILSTETAVPSVA